MTIIDILYPIVVVLVVGNLAILAVYAIGR